MTKKLHDLEVEDYLADCVSVYPEALQEEFVRIPADLAYWNSQYASAVRKLLRAELAESTLKARLRIAHRETLAAENVKVTESMVEAAVDQDASWQEARLLEIEAEVEKVRLHGVVDAVRTKRDMLISIGAHVRAEMAGDPSLRERARGRSMVDG